VDCDATDVTRDRLDFSGMDTSANGEAKSLSGFAYRGRAPNCALGPVELGEHTIAGRFDEAALVAIDRRRRLAIVLPDEVTPALGPKLGRAAGRINDVSEDDRSENPSFQGVLLAERPHRLEVHPHPWLVPDDPGIVSGWDLEDLAGADLEFRAVGHLGPQAACERNPQMMELARVSAGYGLYVNGPAPARLVGHPADDRVVELDDIDPTTRNRPYIARFTKSPSLETHPGLPAFRA
jgi:hypothetical protein